MIWAINHNLFFIIIVHHKINIAIEVQFLKEKTTVKLCILLKKHIIKLL